MAQRVAAVYFRSVPSAPGGAVIGYLSPLLAVLVGIVHAAIAPVIVIGGVIPNLMLVAVVLVTCLAGFLPGITWAFVGGLTVNLLTSEPLGSIPLALLLVAALTAGGARLIGRMVWVYPVVAAGLGSIVADLVMLGVTALVDDVRLGEIPTDLLLGAAVLNAVICGIALVPARLLAMRWVADEAGAW